MDIAREIARLPLILVQLISETILQGVHQPLEAAMAFERRGFQFLFATDGRREGIPAFLENRLPSFLGR